ncbi:hypothetical protein HII36_26970 [Nonomuraea sp. NN258]|uniref:hypothetical protein n=1 Tax=Nonomuraea antri TaxID=2730852 RepID=UPI001568BDC7|nr:hypothetical protein [Nonomuraea antri]NRQ35444.1 hypothetical protein [Nonomuraea antri]
MPDPDRAAAEAALRSIKALSDEHWWTLHPSCTLLEGQAWVGPAGERFGQDVHEDQRGLRALLTSAVEDAERNIPRPGAP